jgi:hypothetical protein
MMRANLKVILASLGTAALLASPAVAGTERHSYYAPHAYGYGYFKHSGPYSYYRRGGAMGNPNYHLGNCVRRAFPQCSGGN